MIDLLYSSLFIEILGYIAVLILAISFQINDRKYILSFLILAAIFLSVHQFLLGALVGAFANGLTVVRNLVFWNKNDAEWAQHFIWPYVFASILGGVSLWFWQDWYSVLPALAVICSTFALWMNSTTHIRFLSILGPLLWIPYAVHIGSTPTLILQIVFISSIVIAIFRFDRRRESKSSE